MKRETDSRRQSDLGVLLEEGGYVAELLLVRGRAAVAPLEVELPLVDARLDLRLLSLT